MQHFHFTVRKVCPWMDSDLTQHQARTMMQMLNIPTEAFIFMDTINFLVQILLLLIICFGDNIQKLTKVT